MGNDRERVDLVQRVDVVVVEMERGHGLQGLDEVKVFGQIVEFHEMEMQLFDARIIRIRLHPRQCTPEVSSSLCGVT